MIKMVRNRNKKSFLIILLIMFVLFLSMISLIFDFTGNFFIFELFLMIIFFIIAVILMGGVYNSRRWAWKGLLIFFEINLINQLVIYFRNFVFTDVVLPLMVSILGFLIGFIKALSEEDYEIEEYGEESELEDINIEENEVKKEFKPGKYMASKAGNSYHAPKCDWAKKIKEKNRVWFDSEEEAKKNYKAHNCVK